MDIEFEKLWRISRELHLSLAPDEALCKILTALTAGEGLAFNRAFLYENKGGVLALRMKIGAETEEEAYKVWEEISKKPHGLEDLLKSCEEKTFDLEPSRIVEIPMDNVPDGFFENGPVKIEKPEELPDVFKRVIDYLPAAIVPLRGENHLLGIIIVDNKFNKDPITEIDIRTLELYAALASNVIERTILFQKLQKKQDELEKAYRELQEYHKRVLKLEKFAAVGEIASTFTHELRTPITIMGGYAELLYRSKDLPPVLLPKVETILRTAKRMETIIKNLSDYIKSPEPEIRKLKAKEFLDYLSSLLDIETKRKNIELKLYVEDDIEFHGDPSLLEHAFLNILRNSIEALKDGGVVQVECRLDNGNVLFMFKDNGPGIPPEMLKNLYIPFHTTKRQGLGLGLAITKKIILLHNGRIEIESQQGKGTTVKVYLPQRGGDKNG
ncbi:hypothetical protein DRQ23_05700 [bacterium]|nr:MAG: hypothetical protein DRQ23_05700 [bacterium]